MFDPKASRMVNTVYATLFTWVITALGAALVFLVQKHNQKILDICLGFAAGVMLAVTFSCILTPAMEMAEQQSSKYEDFSFVPVAAGLLLGSGFVLAVDLIMAKIGAHDAHESTNAEQSELSSNADSKDVKYNLVQECPRSISPIEIAITTASKKNCQCCNSSVVKKIFGQKKFSRLVLLVIAITVHNIPEGLAVGVSFGAIGKSESATFEKARTFAMGVAFHSLPEGLAVSLPIRGLGLARWKAFLLGQVSGFVEPIFGVVGCLVVSALDPVLPYALAFAAGTMFWVVIDDILPETRCNGNGKFASIATMLGFTLMMSLEMAFKCKDDEP